MAHKNESLRTKIEQTLRTAYIDNYSIDTTRDLTEALTDAVWPLVLEEMRQVWAAAREDTLQQVEKVVNSLKTTP